MLITYLAVVTGRSVFFFFSLKCSPPKKNAQTAVCNVKGERFLAGTGRRNVGVHQPQNGSMFWWYGKEATVSVPMLRFASLVVTNLRFKLSTCVMGRAGPRGFVGLLVWFWQTRSHWRNAPWTCFTGWGWAVGSWLVLDGYGWLWLDWLVMLGNGWF